jgi:hypothetical protein
MGYLACVLLIAGLQVAAASVAHVLHGKKHGRYLPMLIASAALTAPFSLPPHPSWARFGLALVAAMGVLRCVDVWRDKAPRSLLFRIQHVVTALDTRRITRASPTFPARQALTVLGFAVLSMPGLYVVRVVAPAHAGMSGLLLRWAGGLLFAYAISDVTYGGLRMVLMAVGFDVYELHRMPLLSRTVKEFWGERWNRTVSAWFAEHLLRPLARRGHARLGVLCSFLASGVLHAYLVFAAIGGTMTLVMFGYFMVQGALVLLELRLRAARWSPAVGHVWTVTVMVVPSPLFVEPLVRALEL